MSKQFIGVHKVKILSKPMSTVLIKRLRIMQFDALRLEIWQRMHRMEAPTQEIAYGHAVSKFLDDYEDRSGTKLLPNETAPERII